MWVVLLVLKIIAYVLLFLLSLALLILVIIAFTPIRYHIKSDNVDKCYVSFNIFIWFKMFGLSYFYKNGIDESKIHLFWRKFDFEEIFKSDDEEEEVTPKPTKKNKSNEAIKEKTDGNNKSGKSSKSSTKDENIKAKKSSFKRKKIGNTINIVKEKIDDFKLMENKREILNHTLIFFKDFIKVLKNKIFNVYIKFGFDEPDMTGMTLGFGCILNSMLPIKVNLEPDFDGECFSYKCEIKGRTSVLFIIIPIAKYILKKPIWNLIFNGKGEN